MKNKLINHIALCALLTTANVMASEINSAIMTATSEAHKSINLSKPNSPQLSPHHSPQLSPRDTLKHSSSGPINIPTTPTINLEVSSYNADSTSSPQSPSRTPSPRSLPQGSQSSDALKKRISLEKSLKILKNDASAEEEKEEEEELKNKISLERFFKLSSVNHTYYEINKDGTLNENRILTPEDKDNATYHYKANLIIDDRTYAIATHLISTEEGALEFKQEQQFSARTTLTTEQVNTILQQTNETLQMVFAFDNFGNSYHISNFEVAETENPSCQGNEEQSNSDQFPVCAYLLGKDNKQYECYWSSESKIIIDQMLGKNSYTPLYSEEIPEERNDLHPLLNIGNDQWIKINKNNDFFICTYLRDNDDIRYECLIDGSRIIINRILGEDIFTSVYSEEMPEKRKEFNQLLYTSKNQCIIIDKNNNFRMGTITERIITSNPDTNNTTPTSSAAQGLTITKISTTPTSQEQEITPIPNSETQPIITSSEITTHSEISKKSKSGSEETTPQTKKEGFNPTNDKNRTTHKIFGSAILMFACLAVLYKLNKLPIQLTDGVANILNSLVSNRFYNFTR